MTDMRITVLVEDTVNRRNMLAEHGLSFWIELGDRKILFDTGQSNLIIENSQKLGIDLKTTDAIVLSHGHYDHTGGLADVLDLAPCAKIYAHHNAFAKRYSRNQDGTSRENGIPGPSVNALRWSAGFMEITGPTEICDGFYVTGPIPRLTDFEDTGGAFFKDEACTFQDDIIDDQAAFMVGSSGVVVILGCAHAGVINTLRYVEQLTECSPIHTVIGGMHLVSAGQERMDKTMAALRGMCIERLIPCHCTGMRGVSRLWQEFPEKCSACPVGTIIEF